MSIRNKWVLKLSEYDLDRLTVTETLITNRRWMMEHRTFLYLCHPQERDYWKGVLSGKKGKLPLQSRKGEGSMIEWYPDRTMTQQIHSLWDDARKPREETSMVPTDICIQRLPEISNSYMLRQEAEGSELADEEKEILGHFDHLFDVGPDEAEAGAEEPVRIFVTEYVRSGDNLNLGLPKSTWPILQMGKPFTVAGRLRDFVRIRKQVTNSNGEYEMKLMAVIAPCPCEWVEDIQDISVRQGGIHKTNEPRAEVFLANLKKLVGLHTQAELPLHSAGCSRTLIL